MGQISILYCGYRSWSIKIFNLLNSTFNNQSTKLVLISSTEQFNKILDKKFDLVFFVGWSEMVPKNFIDINYCIALHPSLLPQFRGGSPIQNQILNDVYDSGITLFKMNEKVDSGPIIRQVKLSLRGELKTIFKNIIKTALPLIIDVLDEYILNGKLKSYPQDDSVATYYKRRKPKDSVISIDELIESSADKVHNKIRLLQNPYPNAFIRFKDGSELYLLKSKIRKR